MSKPKLPKPPKPQSTRPKLLKVDEDMRRWSAAVEEELSRWPDVHSRPMFGMIAYYRGTQIFAAVPRTRAPVTKRSMLIKLPATIDDPRIRSGGPGAGWVTFEMEEDVDIAVVLQWMLKAYERAQVQAEWRCRL